MNVFQIECFLALAEALNFTKAASSLYVSQSSLSRTISSLESELGAQLLVRTKRSVRLTEAGKAFAEECPGLVSVFRNSINKVRLTVDGKRGNINFGIQRDVFEYFSVDLIRDFQKEYPDIHIDIQPHTISDLLRRVSDGFLDAVIAAGDPPSSQIKRLLINIRQECVALPLDHPMANRLSIKMEELKEENFIAMSPMVSSSGYNLLIRHAFLADFTPKIVAHVDCVPSAMMLVACGKGVCILYKDLSAYAYDRIRFVPLNVEPFERYLMWNGASQNPCLHLLTEFAQKRAGLPA